MKPRVFIGSSVEGVNVAEAIQRHLKDDAEVKIWHQGVFELSKTSIESLENALDSFDFGIFVFNNEDILKIRGEEKSAVRDNLIFEFGLFIGKLTRERVFFVIPSGSDLHLPTDLLGITYGQYDANQSDDNIDTATKIFSNQVRIPIKALGRFKNYADNPGSLDSKQKKEYKFECDGWHDDFIEKNYTLAREKLISLCKTEKNANNKLPHEMWIAYCDFKLDKFKGIEELDKLLNENMGNIEVNKFISDIYSRENYLDKSISILKNARKKFDNDPSLITRQANILKRTEGLNQALTFLEDNKEKNSASIDLLIYYYLLEKKEDEKARKYIHSIYQKFPNNDQIKYRYARLAIDRRENEIALYLLDNLTKKYPENPDYWAFLGNCAIFFDYNDLALSAYKKAEELTNSQQSWIVGNIGNVYNNRGFYSEAIEYLKRAIDLDKDDDYAYDRTSSAIKNRSKEKEKIKESCAQGQKLLNEYIIEE
uniref:Tetratricopeptide domain protein n=1 Tax=Methanococcus maripaludis (strain C6 / ATCC BAA-1332) TaxID=444158 RepID=A9A6G6_METM6